MYKGYDKASITLVCGPADKQNNTYAAEQLRDENQHTVFYQEGEEIEALERERLGRTTLTALLDCCQIHCTSKFWGQILSQNAFVQS